MSNKKSNTIIRKRTSSVIEEEKSCTNQKKSGKDFYLNAYMSDIIKEKLQKGKKIMYCCEICPGKPIMVRKSVYRHILSSETHQILAMSKEQDHKNLKKLIEERIKKTLTKNPMLNKKQKIMKDI